MNKFYLSFSIAILIAIGLLYLSPINHFSQKEHITPTDKTPTSFWLNDRHGCLNDWSKACVQSPCITRSAKAIVSSGRPYPNEIRDKITGRLISYDVWVGSHLYVIGGSNPLFARWEGFPKGHPFSYHYISTSIDSLLKSSAIGLKNSKVGRTLDGYITCDADRTRSMKISSLSDKAYGNQNIIAMVIRSYANHWHEKHTVEQFDRPDIKMHEIIVKSKISESVVYVPYSQPVEKYLNGDPLVNVIYCDKRYEPESPFDGSYCISYIDMGDGYRLNFKVYQQHMLNIPVIYDRIIEILNASRII